jgi:hypothetical protein
MTLSLTSHYPSGFVSKSIDDNQMLKETQVNSHQPIDILFLGSHNSHREKVHQMFLKLAEEEELNVGFYFRYDAFDFARETLIDQAKVLLSLSLSSVLTLS